MNCPICDEKLSDDKYYMDNRILLEHHQICPNGCYSEHYVTGYTQISIGDNFELVYSYDKGLSRFDKLKLKMKVRFERMKRKEL